MSDEESLFTYPPGQTAADFSVPNHEPAFVEDVVGRAQPEVVDACGGNVRCIFDATETGNLAIGLSTLETEETNRRNNLEGCE